MKLNSKKKIGRRISLRLLVSESYEDGIKIFLDERNNEHRNYIRNLLLKSSIEGIVTKDSFSKLYDEFSPEEQEILLEKFKKVRLN